MTSTADLDLLRRALDQTTSIVAGLDATQGPAATPCLSWSVADVMNHLLNDLTQFETSVAGGELDWSSPTPAVDADAWASTFASRSSSLLDVWATAEDTGSLGMQLAELSLHAWDLAKATDQSVVLDDEVAQRGLDWMSGMLKPEYRGSEADGKSFGPEVAADADASAVERLVAFSGRSLG